MTVKTKRNQQGKMPSVLFICTANICRSPMANALFKQKIRNEFGSEGWLITSAGTWATNGTPASQNSIIVMKEKGLDIHDHRSQIVSRELLQKHNLVLTMERGHKEALQIEFPELADRVYLLSEMFGGKFDIHDPYGRLIEDYRVTANELDQILSDGFDKICQLADEKGISKPDGDN
jgi:protein-tyrosine-phosphatase